MSKELSFKHLPFVPVKGQVIYVEQEYNAKLNKSIRHNYEWLINTFNNNGMEFCYLPLLAEEAISYNAPYVDNDSRNRKVENVPSLADYIEGAQLDLPVLVFALSLPVNDAKGNIVLQAVDIETKWYTSIRSTFEDLVDEIKSVTCRQTKHYQEIKDQHDFEEALRKKFEEEERRRKKEAHDEECSRKYSLSSVDDVLGMASEDIHQTRLSKREYPEGTKFSLKRGDDIQEEHSLKKPRKTKFSITTPDKNQILYRTRDPEKADSNFDFQSQLLIDEIKQRIAALRNRGVNTMILHDIIDEDEHISRLRITKDFRIFLLDYDNMEIKMPVLPKSVFILFLRHPEGIRFKELTDYYSELLQIYLKMNPNGGRSKHEQSIQDITDPCSNSINEKCARIREAFVSNFDDRLAKNYYVTGKRGEAKRITLDESMVIWE